MKLKKITIALIASVGLVSMGHSVFAQDSVSGKAALKSFKSDNMLGDVIVNPYGVAPLTAVIYDYGKVISDVKVTVQGKPNGGVPITYKVKNSSVLTHGGIPVFGMYADYLNVVTVEYKLDGKQVKEDYKIHTPGINFPTRQNQTSLFPTITPITVKAGFEDRLYLFNHLYPSARTNKLKWKNDGGALEWGNESLNWISDTKGDVRWYLDSSKIYDPNNLSNTGSMMGFRQDKDGKLVWIMSQSYMKYDLLGRQAWKRDLPGKYIDASHAIWPTENGTYLIRVAAADYLRKDGKHVNTVRDQIIEVNETGDVIDAWDLNTILNPYRDNLLKAVDQGAVCLNIDLEKQGKTVNPEELEDVNAPFGDIPGVGAGRNWAHVNSVYYDAKDDSIILSVRHQGVIKVSRDKKVVWILSSPDGWTGDFANKVLKPVDRNGKPLKCENNVCEGDFDWSWAQHTAWGTAKGTVTVFDNGDARGMEQPALPTEKYSRAVEYKVDEKNMTVQQIWEYGKERGYDWYSPITSITEYRADRDTMFVYSATPGLFDGTFLAHPYLHEFKYGTKEPVVEMAVKMTMPKMSGYQAMPINIEDAF